MFLKFCCCEIIDAWDIVMKIIRNIWFAIVISK